MAEPWLRQNALAHRALERRAEGAREFAAEGAQEFRAEGAREFPAEGARALPAEGAHPGVRIRLEPPSGQLALRGDAADAAFAGAVEKTLGIALPAAANLVSGDDLPRILWLGPDEWLVACHDGEQAAIANQLDSALDGLHFLVTDVSHSRAVLRLAGARAREVLAKGCSLDLDPVAFGPGRCAQAPLARAHMLLHQIDDEPGYHVYVHRSFADYVFAWLCDAAAEYGLVIESSGI